VPDAQTCPNCGEPLPPELGQHALTPTSGLVQCPSCGETVSLPGLGDDAVDAVPDTSGDPETFSGEETVAGVMEELSEKPGGPEAST
jgi:ribosomal protein L32